MFLDSFVMPAYTKDMSNVTQIDPEILNGTPIFQGTRVPVKNLFDYLEGGSSVDDFIDDFPAVKKEQVIKFLEELREETTKKPKVA